MAAFASIIALALICHQPGECRGFSPALLLNDPAIVCHLLLSEEQKTSLRKDVRRYVSLRIERASRVRVQSEEANVGAKIDAESRAIEEKCLATIEESQRERLRELSWRLLGVDAFTMPEHRRELEIDLAERERFAPIVADYVDTFQKVHERWNIGELSEEEFETAAEEKEGEAVKAICEAIDARSRDLYAKRIGGQANVSKWRLRTQWSASE